ncbi:MAG TPA: Pr6Pr family membrane protein [Solirubrobacteraceae bacterium]|nr:Pr6Pr family membrane protein [Solirubrobacteraceae bacterium]
MAQPRRAGVGLARLVCGLLAAVALTDAAVNSSDIGHFFSFFTIESNILGCVVLLVGGLADPDSRGWSIVRAAATLYLTITGIVYAALLAHQDLGLISPWVNDVLHRAMPLLMLADWVLFEPWPTTSRSAALSWLAGPLAFLVYSLIRGPIVHWYPYPFLDPRRRGGYTHVALTCVILAIGMALLALIISWIGDRRSAAWGPR